MIVSSAQWLCMCCWDVTSSHDTEHDLAIHLPSPLVRESHMAHDVEHEVHNQIVIVFTIVQDKVPYDCSSLLL
jgi:hypothetical protein